MEIQGYIELLRPEPKFGTDIVNVCLPAEYASDIADLLEGMAAKEESWREALERANCMRESAVKEALHEKNITADYQEENEIIWSALEVAIGRMKELRRAAG